MGDLILLSFCGAFLVFLVFLLVKNDVTFKNHNKIIDAIDAYAKDTRDFAYAMLVLSSMEDYNKTFWRLSDFGCENILPREDYELIKPYIREKKDAN